MKVLLASSNNRILVRASYQVQHQRHQPRKQQVLQWNKQVVDQSDQQQEAGPRNSKSEDFMTVRSLIKSNVQKHALMIESQGINVTEAFMTTAKQNECEPQTSFANEATSSSYIQVD
jgi:hypothetical protein